MTHASDELLSALIDGEDLPSGDAAHVDGCPECQERLDALRGAVSFVAAPVTIPAAHVREAAVAAALVDGARRSQPTRRLSALSAAAALVLALGIGGFVLSQIGRDSDNSGSGGKTALREQSKAATADSSNELFSNAAPAAGGTGATSFFNAGFIGDFSDLRPIEAKYREYLAGTAMDDGADFVAPPCPVSDGESVDWAAFLTYQGVDAFARVVTSPDSTQTLQVLRQTDCVLLANQAL